MYKTVEIADVMGSVMINKDNNASEFSIKKLNSVLKSISKQDRFIRVRNNVSSLSRIEDLADGNVEIIGDKIKLHNSTNNNSFINHFYSLDSEVQTTLSQITKMQI